MIAKALYGSVTCHGAATCCLDMHYIVAKERARFDSIFVAHYHARVVQHFITTFCVSSVEAAPLRMNLYYPPPYTPDNTGPACNVDQFEPATWKCPFTFSRPDIVDHPGVTFMMSAWVTPHSGTPLSTYSWSAVRNSWRFCQMHV
jgi:hypothetical protein